MLLTKVYQYIDILSPICIEIAIHFIREILSFVVAKYPTGHKPSAGIFYYCNKIQNCLSLRRYAAPKSVFSNMKSVRRNSVCQHFSIRIIITVPNPCVPYKITVLETVIIKLKFFHNICNSIFVFYERTGEL